MSAAGSEIQVGRMAVRGTFLGAARVAFSYAVMGAAMVVLTRLLTPADFGVYAVVGAVAAVAYALVTTGLASALIVHKEEPSAATLSTAFWTVQGILLVLALSTFSVSLLLEGTHRFLGFCLAAYLILSPLRFPLEISLFRRLRFERLALLEAVEVTVFQASAVGFAIAGYGVRGFGVGLVMAALAVDVLAFAFGGFKLSWPRRGVLQSLLRPALPFQLQAFLQVARERATFPLVAAVAGAYMAGLFSWGYTSAGLILIFAALVSQPLFAAFSRMPREDKRALADAASIATRLLAVVTIGVAAVLAGSIHPLITVVFSDEWLPAVRLFWLLAAAFCLLAVSSPLLQLAQVDGRAMKVVHYQTLLVIALWGLGIPLALVAESSGFALSYALAAALFALLLLKSSEREYTLQVRRPVLIALFCGAASTGAGLLAGVRLGDEGTTALLGSLLVAAATYAGLLALLARAQVKSDARVMVDLLRG